MQKKLKDVHCKECSFCHGYRNWIKEEVAIQEKRNEKNFKVRCFYHSLMDKTGTTSSYSLMPNNLNKCANFKPTELALRYRINKRKKLPLENWDGDYSLEIDKDIKKGKYKTY